METDHTKEDNYLRAKNRVKKLKGFYIHFAVYIVVNTFISTNIIISNIYENGETFNEAFWNFSTFSVWIFWGIGLAIHGFNLFGLPFLFGKDWEERKIKKYMEEDDNQFKSI